MAVELFDPVAGPSSGWPAGAELERDYLTTFRRLGSTALVTNLRTQVLGLLDKGRVLPITVNEAEYGDAYVCLPHTAYSLYARAELDLVDTGAWRPALRILAAGAGAILQAGRINRIVHINNWMLSTNLHNKWDGSDIPSVRATMTSRYSDYFLAIRSLNYWSDTMLVKALLADGWQLVPSRQIYVTDDPAREWSPKRIVKSDLRLMTRSRYVVDDMSVLRPADSARIADLYAQLYLERYSSLNPAFTSVFIELAARSGMLRFLGVRDENGRLMAVVGCYQRGGILTTPILGYDTSRSRQEGLYRIACALLTQLAIETGCKINGSAGAAGFKTLRGAKPVIEYTAFYSRHLAAPRRSLVTALAAILNGVALPLMRARGF